MCGYRLYFLDRNGHIHSALNLECADDDHAIRLAREHGNGAPMELWQGARFVTSIERPEKQVTGSLVLDSRSKRKARAKADPLKKAV
jgi:hypothetical protein